VSAWHATADDLAGIRAALDHYHDLPVDDAMATALDVAAAKGQVLLAASAGRTGATLDQTVAAGRALEERARTTYRPRVAA
jgi:hypothetical protein